MARTTMTALIEQLRGFTDTSATDYTINGVQYWSADHLQTTLERHRTDVIREPLTATPAYGAGGTLSWREYRSGHRWFEQTDGGTAVFVVENGVGADSGTADWSADYNRGLVTFTADQGGTAYYLTARSYDLHGAAADVWRQKAAQASKKYDFSTDNHNLSRSQQFKHCIQMANYYESLRGAQVVELTRSDTP